jgi:transposase-like protein
MSDDDGFDIAQAIEEGAKRVVKYTDALGVERQQHICEHCDIPCQPTTTYNPHTAAFDGGSAPCWSCPDCGRTYVREVDDTAVSMDLYGRSE